jgi:hypothetical protein
VKREKRIDPVTGGDYWREFDMYVNYHGMNTREATELMAAESYKERDTLFDKFVTDHQNKQRILKMRGY